MQQKSKRIIVAILAAVLVLALGLGLLFVFLPNGMQRSDIIAELAEDDFEFDYVSSLAYSTDTEQTSGKNDVYGWGYKPDKTNAEYAYITSIKNDKLTALKNSGVTKLVINIPAEHGDVPVAYVEQDAFDKCALSIVDINMPLSVHWQIKGKSRFKLENNFSFARADGLTATFTGFTPDSGSGITTLILPSNVWIDENSDGKMEDSEPKYRYTEYLFAGNKNAPYTNLVVMPDVVNIFNGTAQESDSNRPKMQGGLLSKSETLKSVFFCTGRSEVLHLYPLTFENCTSLKEISLSAGVYLEDGARVFQGSSALEKFYIADEKTASAPLFYTVGADGALYTNNYSFSYYTQSSTERYYEWWKNGLSAENGWDEQLSAEWAPTKVWDSETNVKNLNLEKSEDPKQEGTQYGTFEGEAASVPTTAKVYKAKQSSGQYDGGIGIPEGSYVFDVNGQAKSGGENDTENDFETGTSDGQYEQGADFKSQTLTTVDGTNAGGTSASIEADNGGGSVKVTEKSGGSQSAATVTINGVEYKSHMQLKQNSERYLEISAPFDFALTVYFAGSYTASQAGTETYPQMGLFDSDHFKGSTYKSYKYDPKKAAGTAKGDDALARLTDAADYTITSGASQLLKIEYSDLKSGKTYYVAQPADDPSGSSGSAQVLFLVITPLKTQSASALVVEQNVSMNSDSPDWQRIPNDALIFQKIPNTDYFLDLRYPTIVRYDKTCELPFRVKAVASGGEVLRTQDIDWAIMMIDGQDVSKNLSVESPAEEADKDGYFTFTLHLQNIFHDSDFYVEGQHKQGRNFVVRFTAGDVTKYIFINLLPAAGNKNIPDANQWTDYADSDTETKYLNLVEENASRYQTLISMPAKAKNDDGAYINSFDFGYHETVEIGPNAFQNTYITVIHIPDRIAKIGASAFRFSDHLQTVYLPDDADIGLNAFGQEADASPQDGTVFTAGKQNFFLIAPSRTSFEQYIKYAAIYTESGAKEPEMPNYNVFPVHAEENENKGFEEWGGKDASYDYTPYLTYEITVKFLKYDEGGGTVKSTETRTFLYGMDAHYVKATATTEWARFDDNYDNNAPVWFGRIKDTGDSKIVQQINTLSTEIAWSVAADGWYYNQDAAIPAGEWYFGELPAATSEEAEERMAEFTKFIGGWNGGHVSSNDIQNLVQVHYQNVMEYTSDAQGITKTGQEEPSELRLPVESYSQDGNYYYTEEFESQSRWSRWYWDEKYNEDGAVVQRFFTMPFSVTLKSKAENRESRIDFDVPTFQNIGEITYGEDTMKAAPEDARDETWDVPMLTVTFDYNGFPMSRIFENFKSSAMEVKYEAWRRWYNDKAWRWDVDSGLVDWSETQWDAMKYSINDEWVPYDAGYYKITLSFESEGTGEYTYYWSGIYNGMRVDANADSKTTFTFILNIRPRKVPLSNVYSMQYSGLGFSLFEDNPYIDVMSYGAWSDGHADYTAEGLPCAVGRYLIKLKLHDPKYPSPNESSWSDDIDKYTPNLEWEGAAGYDKGWAYTQYHESNESVNRFIYTDGVELFILDGKTEVPWGQLYEGSDNTQYLTFTESLAAFGSEVVTYTYTGAPISLEEVFGGVFSSSSIEYTIERNGKSVSEIKDAGTYRVSITPAEGYVWWRGIPSVNYKATFQIDSWSLDEFWEGRGGYEGNEHATLTFEVFVDKRIVSVPRDSYVPKEADPPYEFEVPIGGDYEVMGYHMHDFEPDATLPKASENSKWSKEIYKTGVYDVLIRLTDPANTTWPAGAGESHGDNYYIIARLYAGFDREKDYPTFKTDLGGTEGGHASGEWVTLTHTYDGIEYGLEGDNDLFETADARPTDHESTYKIYKLSQKPNSVEEFWLIGEEAETIKDAGWYGISVILNDPFYFKETEEMFAYYLVDVEKAKIEATFALSDGGKATYDGTDRLNGLNGSVISFTDPYDSLTFGEDYNVIVTAPVSGAEMIDAGEYTVKVELTSSDIAKNYVLTNGETHYTIDPRPLALDLGTITGHTYLDTPLERWHDKEVLTFEGNAEGAIVSQNGVPDEVPLSYRFRLGDDTYSLLSALSDAGDYTVEVLCGNPNYTVTLEDAHYKIAPLTLTLKDIEGVTYDKKEHKPNLSFDGEKMVLTEDEDYTVTYSPDTASGAQLGSQGLPLTAGNYTVTVELLSKNYTFEGSQTVAEKTFTIEKAILSEPYLLYASFPYSDTDVREAVKTALRNYDPDTMDVGFYNEDDGTGDELFEVKDAGTYFVKVTLHDDNYKWKDGTEYYLPFTVSSTAYDMSGVTFESKTVTYDGQTHSLFVQGLPAGISVAYSPNEFVDVGVYTVTATFTLLDSESRYETPEPMKATLTITAATLVVEWEEKDYIYTGSELIKPTAKAQGVDSDGVITMTVTLKAPAGEAFQNAGEYTFEAAFGSGFAKPDNYILVNIEKKYSVAGATLPAPVLGKAFTYTGNDLKAEIEQAFEHYESARMSVAFYATAEATGDPLDKIVGAGTYFAKFTLTDNTNYTWGQAEDMVVPVAVAKRSVVPTLTATDVTATYGDTGNALRPTVSGIPDGYEVTYVYTYAGTDETVYASSTDAPVNVGTYEITVTALFVGGANDEPFTATTTARLTIKARTIGMKLDPESISYNGQEQQPKISFTDLPESVNLVEKIDYTVSYDAEGSAKLGDSKLPLTAGSYTVTVTLLTKNYTFADGNSATATFTVSARTLEMTLSPASVSYNGKEQQPDVSFTGLPESVTTLDKSEYTVSYEAVEGAGLGTGSLPLTVGSYTVTVTLVSGNYTFAKGKSTTATFTIERTTLPAPYLSATVFPYSGEDVCEGVKDVLRNYDPETMNIAFYNNNDGTGDILSEVKEAGTYYLRVTLSDDGYVWKDGSEIYLGFTVLKHTTTSVTISASDVELTYGEAMQYPTVTVNGETEGYKVSYFYTYQGLHGTVYSSSHEAPVNVGTYEVTVTAVYTGNGNHESFSVSATATLTIKARKIGMKLDPASVTYNGQEQQPNISFTGLPESTMLVEKAGYTVSYEAATGAKLGESKLPFTAGSYTVTVTLLTKNYTFESGESTTAAFTVEKAALAVPYLSSASFPYTGEELSEAVRAMLIHYTEGAMKIAFCKTNGGEAITEVKNAGDYFLKVTLTDLSYQWEGGETEVYLPFTVTRKAVPKPSADDTLFVYTGVEQVYNVAESPAYTVSGNRQTNANEAGYKVTVTLRDKANYEWSGGGTADVILLFKIQKADYDMSGVRFSDQTVSFDGEEHSILIEGELPEGVSASYQGNGQISVGGYHVTVTFTGDEANYNPIPSMHALLTIRYEEFDFGEITFEDVEVKYDGNAHSVYIQGKLPEGVDVAYEGNGQREPGVYTVKASFSDARGVILEKTATLTVLRTRVEVVDPNGAVTVIVESADGFDPTWELVCDDVPDSIVRTAWAWEKDSFTASFTLKFVKDGVEMPFDGRMTVRLVIPQTLRDKQFTMQSIGRTTSVEYTRDGDYVVFEADGLSSYVFTSEFTPYLSILQIASGIALVSVLLMIALAIVIKKNKQGE